MQDYWATRTGRWRKALREQAAPSLAERLAAVIRADVATGALPPGALLPPAERVAQELMIEVGEVRAAYASLLTTGVIAQRTHGVSYVAARDGEKEANIGDATQLRFEKALMKAVREAAARGLSTTEATGMFKAAMQRLQETERGKEDDIEEDR